MATFYTACVHIYMYIIRVGRMLAGNGVAAARITIYDRAPGVNTIRTGPYGVGGTINQKFVRRKSSGLLTERFGYRVVVHIIENNDNGSLFSFAPSLSAPLRSRESNGGRRRHRCINYIFAFAYG